MYETKYNKESFFLFSYVVLFHKHLSFKSLEFSGCCSVILKTQSWTLSPNMWQHSVSYTVQLMMNGFSFVLSLSSSGKQAKDKNPEEYIKPSVEWDTGVPWHHSSWHDYQNAQVGWLLCGHQLVLFPRRTCGQFIKWRRKLRPFNPLVDNQQPSVLPSWLIQVTHNCIQVTPTNCSTCCCSSVGSEVPPLPLCRALQMEWSRSSVTILAQKVWRAGVTLHVWDGGEVKLRVCCVGECVCCVRLLLSQLVL